MCQIIAYHSSDWKNVGDLDNKIRDIMYLLKDKGGDFFSVANTFGLIKTKNEKYSINLILNLLEFFVKTSK